MTGLAIACGSDPPFLPHIATLVHSVLEHGGPAVRVHYLHGPELEDDDAARLRSMIERGGGRAVLHRIEPERIAGLARVHFAPPMLWYRAFLPELLPDVPRVLYLDGDTVAVDDLEPLWRTPLDDSYVAAVTNVFMPWDAGYPVALGLPGPEAYFNSGVLLMNLDAMRRDAISDALLEYGRTAPPTRVAWGDQDALNVLTGHRRVALAPRWNCMNSVVAHERSIEIFGREAVQEARERPAIRHFEGPAANKPWHVLCEAALRDEYLRHRRQTPWAGTPLAGDGPRNRARRALRRALARLQRVSA